jgi:hypothetical protein
MTIVHLSPSLSNGDATKEIDKNKRAKQREREREKERGSWSSGIWPSLAVRRASKEVGAFIQRKIDKSIPLGTITD